MYRYSDFDRRLIRQRAAQFRDQLRRHLAGQLSADDFRPLRLQNGWYVQRHAPMLRVAREFDRVTDGPWAGQGGFGHFTTRQNIQFNWIPLARAADVMDVLAEAGIAPDEIEDPRPYCELLRQWSTLHPEFAFLPRKFKIAVTGAADDRAAIAWHDIGLQLRRDAHGAVGFRVLAGGGMGRTPLVASELRAFVPWQEIVLYLEAILRVYNLFGRRDNLYKARLKILVKAEGQRFVDAVEAEYRALRDDDALGAQLRLTPSALAEVQAHFAPPADWVAAGRPSAPSTTAVRAAAGAAQPPAYRRWRERHVQAHRLPGLCAVTLTLKRPVRAEGFGAANHGLLTDLIACPGGDLCSLANARTLPIAAAVLERYQDPDELEAIGELALHISGCMNSCGHHHSGHIGILGVDKDGNEWYQLTLGGSDGQARHGPARAGRVVGPAFAADEIVDALDAVVATYLAQRTPGERFMDTLTRLDLIALTFPRWTDGRAYSLARLLRGRWRWQGQIRAVGDVIPDMALLLWRSGFDAAVLRPGESIAVAQQALLAFDGHYQPDARRAGTAPERAHG